MKFIILTGKNGLVTQRKFSKEYVLNFWREKKLNFIEVSAENNDNFVKTFKEVAYQLYNDIKKDKDNKILQAVANLLIYR